MSIDEASDLYQQFYEERPMPKTVTVEVEIPDGYELAEPKMRRVNRGEYFFGNGQLAEAWDCPTPSSIAYPILRPIPAEKTWERPEWLHCKIKYITHDYARRWRGWTGGPMVFNKDEWHGPNTSDKLGAVNPNLLPDYEPFTPAERIWKIVEPTK